ncbi:alpha/beta fold hydrolase [Nocardia bovistercoris]|uniref:Alpha/beta hydrolase n=1 Tax=Nocardia bovistercoris TaxID=2785916 RepID=A0A931N6M0_9NOCA|nr:alpha/beta hydrolase [Nocardia bovistercoris]MBH0779828.1 alpha/beta hydrolase [Nocardia bovistercoris]
MDLFEGFDQRRVPTGDGVEINVRTAGGGPPLLLLHGYPQTHVAWHKVAPALARSFTVVIPDLRGYGDSGKPDDDSTASAYSKRAMALDQVEVMRALGFSRFAVAGHDRGGRVVHRLCLDHPEAVSAAAVLDIVPTRHAYATVGREMASSYFHWFFLAQPGGLAERLIGAEPDLWLERMLGVQQGYFDPAALAEYRRCFRDRDTIRASCADYRAAAGIDLEHDAADAERKLSCPLLVLWGASGFVGNYYDPLAAWRVVADRVEGAALPSGHFPCEQAPRETSAALIDFFS